MSIQALAEIFPQLIIVETLLAGFCFSGILQLASISDKKRIIDVCFVVFGLCTLILVVSIFQTLMVITVLNLSLKFSAMGMEMSGPGFPHPASIYALMIAPIIGILIFFIGVGLAGWIRSAFVGVFTSVAALIAIGTIIAILSQFIN